MAQTKSLLCKIWSRKNLYDIPKLNMSTSANVMKKEDSTTEFTSKEEIRKFSELSEQWWSLNGPSKALHSMNTVRIPFIRDGLVQYPNEKRSLTPLKDKLVLDVGCGGGILTEALAKIGAEVTGIDPSQSLIDAAQHHCEENTKLKNKLRYLCTTIEEHIIDHKDYYDGVVASEVIEHIDNKEQFVKSCIKALKPGGRIFFTTPNRTRMSQILGIYFAEYIANVIPRGTHQYDMFITPNELTFLLERNDCQVEVIVGLFYNLLQNKWDFVKSQSLIYALQALRLN